jgi:hypothetical protein
LVAVHRNVSFELVCLVAGAGKTVSTAGAFARQGVRFGLDGFRVDYVAGFL